MSMGGWCCSSAVTGRNGVRLLGGGAGLWTVGRRHTGFLTVHPAFVRQSSIRLLQLFQLI